LFDARREGDSPMSASKKVGFAVVGLGGIARSSVLPCFAKTKKARLAALVGRDKKEAFRLARKFRVSLVYSVDEFSKCLENSEISAVYIATPQSSHSQYTVQAPRAGKHVLCEKPLAINVEQSAKMVEECRRNGVLLMTAYRKYFEPSCLLIKKLVQNGELGRIDTIHTAFSELHKPGVSLEWLRDPAVAGGGPLMDLGPYCVNTSRWLVGENPVGATATSWSHDKKRFRDVEEGIAFRLSFPSGLVLQGSTSYGAAMSSFLYVQGTKGWVCLAPAFDFAEERRLWGKISGRSMERRFKVVDEFAPEVDELAAAIVEHRAVSPDGVEGHRDMVILRAIYEAASTQKAVIIRYS
jgi:predicted dehydrogenase